MRFHKNVFSLTCALCLLNLGAAYAAPVTYILEGAIYQTRTYTYSNGYNSPLDLDAIQGWGVGDTFTYAVTFDLDLDGYYTYTDGSGNISDQVYPADGLGFDCFYSDIDGQLLDSDLTYGFDYNYGYNYDAGGGTLGVLYGDEADADGNSDGGVESARVYLASLTDSGLVQNWGLGTMVYGYERAVQSNFAIGELWSTLTLTEIHVVPEPASMMSAGLGLLGVALHRRRKRS